jgi:hypothetical protein
MSYNPPLGYSEADDEQDEQHQETRHHPYKHGIPCSHHNCQKIFPSSSKLKRHMIVHTKEKPFACNICGAEFTQKISLKMHMERYKIYTCRTCHMPNLDGGSLRAHEKVHRHLNSVYPNGIPIEMSQHFPRHPVNPLSLLPISSPPPLMPLSPPPVSVESMTYQAHQFPLGLPSMPSPPFLLSIEQISLCQRCSILGNSQFNCRVCETMSWTPLTPQ